MAGMNIPANVWQQKMGASPDYMGASSGQAFGQAPVQGLFGMLGQEGSGFGPAQFSTLGGAQVGSEAADGVQKMYDSAPAAMTGGAYFKDGYTISPTAGGNYAVYKPAAPGMSADLNGTNYDIYDKNQQFQGTNQWSGLGDPIADMWDKAIPLATMAMIGGGVAGGFGYGPFAGGGAAPGAVGTGGGFVGEGALSGVPAWDAALTGTPAWTGSAGAGAAGLGNVGSGGGFVGEGASSGIPAWDSAAGLSSSGGGGGFMDLLKSGASKMFDGGSGGTNWLGLGATALGALAGSQGQNASQTQQSKIDPRFDPYLFGSLFPNAQNTLNGQLPGAQAGSAALNSTGMGLLGSDLTPDIAANPYFKGVADDLQKRTQDLLAQNNSQIRGNAVSSGTLGGSRQGVAQGQAAAKAADFLQGNLSNLYNQAYQQEAQRALAKITLGSGLLGQGQQFAWAPMQYARDIFAPFANLNQTTTSGAKSGGGLLGALGGGLGAAQFANNMGLFGSN